jgi:coenzyme F420-reducing hydrogenase delta subunit
MGELTSGEAQPIKIIPALLVWILLSVFFFLMLVTGKTHRYRSALFILLALQQGADGVLVAGCKPGECHYKQGNYVEQSRLSLLQDILGSMGLPGRVHFAQFGAADRGKFAQAVEQMVTQLAGLDGGRR